MSASNDTEQGTITITIYGVLSATKATTPFMRYPEVRFYGHYDDTLPQEDVNVLADNMGNFGKYTKRRIGMTSGSKVGWNIDKVPRWKTSQWSKSLNDAGREVLKEMDAPDFVSFEGITKAVYDDLVKSIEEEYRLRGLQAQSQASQSQRQNSQITWRSRSVRRPPATVPSQPATDFSGAYFAPGPQSAQKSYPGSVAPSLHRSDSVVSGVSALTNPEEQGWGYGDTVSLCTVTEEHNDNEGQASWYL